MCVSLLSLGSMAASAVETGGTLQAIGSGANAIGDLAAGVTRARMSRADARAEKAMGQARADRIRTAGEAELSRARSGAVAGNVSLSSGSVLAAEQQVVTNVEQDALSEILTGNNRARSLNASARYYTQAGMNNASDGLLYGYNTWKRTRDKGQGGGGGYIPQAGE